jgi:hypothetical protein
MNSAFHSPEALPRRQARTALGARLGNDSHGVLGLFVLPEAQHGPTSRCYMLVRLLGAWLVPSRLPTHPG